MENYRESNGRESEGIEMENKLVTTDEHEMVEHMQVEEEEGDDDYFQDPTDISKYHQLGKICLHTKFCHCLPSLPVPVIDPIPTERFPEYVRDMLYGEENKLKAEFLVRSPYMVSLPFVFKNIFV